MSAGFRTTCAVRKDDNQIECWGRTSKSKKYLSDDSFQSAQISMGQDHACAVSGSGEVDCWGSVLSNKAHIVPLELQKRTDDSL